MYGRGPRKNYFLEVFRFKLSASAFVMPVVEIDGVAVGAGTPGHRAVRLREIYLDESRKAAV